MSLKVLTARVWVWGQAGTQMCVLVTDAAVIAHHRPVAQMAELFLEPRGPRSRL